MNRLFLFMALLCSCLAAQAQQTTCLWSPFSPKGNVVTTDKPHFPGCETRNCDVQKLYDLLRELNLQKTTVTPGSYLIDVYIAVNKHGVVRKVNTSGGASSINAAIEATLMQLPKMLPARKNDQPVDAMVRFEYEVLISDATGSSTIPTDSGSDSVMERHELANAMTIQQKEDSREKRLRERKVAKQRRKNVRRRLDSTKTVKRGGY